MLELHVILRTCSHTSVHFKERFIPVSKHELIVQCTKSLVLSLLAAPDKPKIKLTIVDDHSDEKTISALTEILAHFPYESEFIRLEGSGNNDSMKACYLLAKNSTYETIYLVEDDYLHSIPCFTEMIEAYDLFTEKMSTHLGSGTTVALMPVDNMFHYHDNTMFTSPLVLGTKRHWRVNYYSNWTLLLPRKSIIEHWDQWWKLSDYELSRPETHEDATIVQVFKSTLHLFTPVPTLALHVASPAYISPFTDWKKMWDDVTLHWEKTFATDATNEQSQI